MTVIRSSDGELFADAAAWAATGNAAHTHDVTPGQVDSSGSRCGIGLARVPQDDPRYAVLAELAEDQTDTDELAARRGPTPLTQRFDAALHAARTSSARHTPADPRDGGHRAGGHRRSA